MTVGVIAHVFPTGVGVNRSKELRGDDEVGIPHRRGGEPNADPADVVNTVVFPTGVGVNRVPG